jgi:hypothetical protein
MKGFLKKIFSKNKSKKMSLTEIKTIDDLKREYQGMEFQWVKGEMLSGIEQYKDISSNGDSFFIHFDSGRRMNISLLDEFMMYYPAPPRVNIPIPVDHQEINENKPLQKKSTVTDISYGNINSDSFINEESPIYKLLKKQKRNPVEVSIKIKLDLPSRELYSVLSESFEDAENEILNFILDGVDIEDIKKSLSESIRKNYYLLKIKEEEEKPQRNSTPNKRSKNGQ